MKKNWAIRKDAEAVSPVIATILMVAITVVLAAVLYVMVSSFGGTGTQTPTGSISTSTSGNAEKLTFGTTSKTIAWSDIKILLSDGTRTASWTPTVAALSTGSFGTEDLANATLGTMKVDCKVVDQAGNGGPDNGDHFTLTPYVNATAGAATVFAVSTTYTVTILYIPSSGQICAQTW
jgi:flagellin-like protein